MHGFLAPSMRYTWFTRKTQHLSMLTGLNGERQPNGELGGLRLRLNGRKSALHWVSRQGLREHSVPEVVLLCRRATLVMSCHMALPTHQAPDACRLQIALRLKAGSGYLVPGMTVIALLNHI